MRRREASRIGDGEGEIGLALGQLERRLHGGRRRVDAEDLRFERGGEIPAVAPIAATDVDEPQDGADAGQHRMRVEASDGQASELARAVAPQLAVPPVAPVPVRRLGRQAPRPSPGITAHG